MSEPLVLGVISDTHGLVRPEVHEALKGVYLILHDGDVGGDEVLDELNLIAPVAAVFGNTDPPGHPRLVERIPDAVVHGRGAPRAPHILSISVPGTDSESLLMALDMQGVACSAGSACQSGSVTPSHVLAAMGVRADLASAAIRMSLGSLTRAEDVQRVAELFPALIQKARRLSGAA